MIICDETRRHKQLRYINISLYKELRMGKSLQEEIDIKTPATGNEERNQASLHHQTAPLNPGKREENNPQY